MIEKVKLLSLEPSSYDASGKEQWITMSALFALENEYLAKRARVEELEAENRALKEQLEAIGAGGVQSLRSNGGGDSA